MNNFPNSRTLVYSTVDNLELKLDLHFPPNAAGALPAIVSFHGGGLTTGSRQPGLMSPAWLLGL
jgi:acetyl esterase/lipase